MSVMQAMTDEQYLAKGGNVCPFCGSEEISGEGSVQVDSNEAWQTIVCRSCDKEWMDVYRLIGYSHSYDVE